MKTQWTSVALTSFFCISVASAAAPEQTLVQGILDCEGEAHLALVDYQRAAKTPGDTSLQSDMNTQLGHWQQCAARVPQQLEASGEAAGASRLRQSAAALAQAFASAAAELQAGHDGAATLLQQRHREFVAVLEGEERRLVSNKRVDAQQAEYLAHKVAANVRQLEVLYLARDKPGHDASMEQLAGQVDTLMASLQLRVQEQHTKWKPIQATWWFMRKAALEGDNQGSGFIVGYQTTRLVGLLNQLHEGSATARPEVVTRS